MSIKWTITLVTVACWIAGVAAQGGVPPKGYRGVPWGSSPAEAAAAMGGDGWRQVTEESGFPADLGVTLYRTSDEIAGYSAEVTGYFFENRFFQVTIRFPFPELVTFDFNYNVFRSVDEYYRAIRSKTLVFVRDIYNLLEKKYGKKQPVFKGLSPEHIFVLTDKHLKQERWNFRYNPSEYYKAIVSAAYARWDFPRTRVTFSLAVAAPDKRFDYRLSLTSLDLEREINKKKDALRMQGL